MLIVDREGEGHEAPKDSASSCPEPRDHDGQVIWARAAVESPAHEIVVDESLLSDESAPCPVSPHAALQERQAGGTKARKQCPQQAQHGASSLPGPAEAEEEERQGAQSAWATLVYDVSYLPGALTVLHSLRETCAAGPTRDLVLLVALAQDDAGERREDAHLHWLPHPAENRAAASSEMPVRSGRGGGGEHQRLPGVGDAERDRDERRAQRVRRIQGLAASVGARVKFVEEILSPHEQMVGREDLRAAYSKLHVWNLTEYSKVVYLDADLLILRCPEGMFDGDHFTMGSWPFSAQHVSYDERGRRHFPVRSLGIITCAFLAHPGEDIFYTMLALAETAPSFDGSDGGLLNGFFPDHSLWPPHLVAWKRTVSKFKMVWTDFAVSAVDFTGRPKPWHDAWLRRADPVDRVYYLPLFLEWWDRWFAYRKGMSGHSIHTWTLGQH